MVFDSYGEPEVMRLRDVPIPEPQDAEVLIRVAYAGVNPADSKTRGGDVARAGYKELAFPFVTGRDASGVVERTVGNVGALKVGDRVVTWSSSTGNTWGSYAEFVRVPAANVSPMPKSLDFAQAACIPVAALTAYQSLFHPEKGALIPGQRVLIHGAAGGVGSFAVQLAKSGALSVAATCRTDNVAYVKSLGADRVIDYKTEDIDRVVRDWSSSEGVDVVLDAVGPATLPQALDLLRPKGRLISILTVTGDGDMKGDQAEAERRGFRKIVTVIDLERARESMSQITRLIDSGRVRVPPLQVLRLEDAAQAHRIVDGKHTRGKLVLLVADLTQ
jgi:NADPH2:quinone reductase